MPRKGPYKWSLNRMSKLQWKLLEYVRDGKCVMTGVKDWSENGGRVQCLMSLAHHGLVNMSTQDGKTVYTITQKGVDAFKPTHRVPKRKR